MTVKQFRLNSFTPKDHKSVIVAIDHGLMWGALPGIENLYSVVERLNHTSADGLLVSPITAKLIRESFPSFDKPLIVGVDYVLGDKLVDDHSKEMLEHRVLWKTEEVLKYGAKAVKMFLNFGDDSEMLMRNIQAVREVVRQSEQWHVPVMIEVLFMDNKKFALAENKGQMLMDASRIAYELGADILKVQMLDDLELYSKLKRDIPLPLFLLGGSKMDEQSFINQVAMLLEREIDGVTFGRNVWQSDRMEHLIGELSAVARRPLLAGN